MHILMLEDNLESFSYTKQFSMIYTGHALVWWKESYPMRHLLAQHCLLFKQLCLVRMKRFYFLVRITYLTISCLSDLQNVFLRIWILFCFVVLRQNFTMYSLRSGSHYVDQYDPKLAEIFLAPSSEC